MPSHEALIDKIQTCVLRVKRIIIMSQEQHTDAAAAFQALKAMAALLAPGAEARLRQAEQKGTVTPERGSR
jgi:hypothetical protein